MRLQGKRIVVGVGGGIAAMKAPELVRELGRRGAEVRVALTPAGARFVGPLTFGAITNHPAVVDLWDPSFPGEVHVDWGAWADAVVVAPTTMNMLARAAVGMADDVVLATVACARGPILFAPAMHHRMWRHETTRRNVARLEADGARFVGPVVGELANSEVGEGRMAEPTVIADAVEHLLAAQDLEGVRLLVTAGPTVEDLDPVRFLGNRSSGRMGFAIATRAAARGATVTLVSGPVSLQPPFGVETIFVRSALEMRDAVMSRAQYVDTVVMAAAVSDYRPETRADDKLKRGENRFTLELVQNPDILAELGASRDGELPVLIGFAVETRDLIEAARGKLERKHADLIVANEASHGFGEDTNQAALVTHDDVETVAKTSKHALADRILDRARALLDAARPE